MNAHAIPPPSEDALLDLSGWSRLAKLELHAWRSPRVVISAMGVLVGGAVLLVSLRPDGERASVTFVAGCVLLASVLGLVRARRHSLRTLPCPTCGRSLTHHRADADYEVAGLAAPLEMNGAHYGNPFRDDHDARRWIRLQQNVAACLSCRVYITIELREETCTEEEVAALDERMRKSEEGC